MGTEIVEVQVQVAHLRRGMYVCRLDRPWVETAYDLQGFLIQSDEDVAQLRSLCEHVFIDDVRSVHDGRRIRRDYSALPKLIRADALDRLQRLGYRSMRGLDRPPIIPVEFPKPISLAKELPRARVAWKQARTILGQCIARAKAGKPLLLEDLETAIEDVVASVIRSPDAALWLTGIRRQEAYTLSHPLNCCALLMVFSRFLGFPPELLNSLGKGAVLMDIGMWRLNKNYYVNRDVIDTHSREHIQEHVLAGLDYLEESGFVDYDARLMILHHHERFDGTGYPRSVRGVNVSLMGFMLHLVDAYDALMSRRSYSPEHNYTQVHRALYGERDQAVPADVLEAFFQSLGVYPTGSLVELSNGAVAAVAGQNASSRLYPRLILLTEADRTPLKKFIEIESTALMTRLPAIKIVRAVPANSISVRLEQIEPESELE